MGANEQITFGADENEGVKLGKMVKQKEKRRE